jgi:uncharacterized protein (TIGR03000 family)
MRTLVRLGLWAVLAAGLTAVAAPAQAPAQVKSKLTVLLPQDDAELLIEGQPTKATGEKRVFETPPLEAGKAFEYKLEAKWAPNNYTRITRTRTVTFKGGEELTVDLAKEDPTDRAVIRYVPTPDDIVAEMMKLAKITKDDVVFEPGCGDARISTAAVKAGAKKAVGIDLDPERITEAKETIKKAGVEGKVELRLGDALDIKDLGDASVVFLYMGNEFDMLIRPHVWRQLKVGSRVVSHRFLMGDWKPEKTVKVTGQDGDEYELLLWVVTEAEKKRAAEKK